ncbi:PadR family transcriptional regulator [Fundicoccus culcitae]|uniref:Helix-turn-helix transcriptional regulator n=1 Tax=Fundicoccus culcitae TaxID=2969821 RepID=A0ABY5P7R9_9LACT|nr:helix-turn-helix transcriptional regulator [Fundicoccus culcitae]UUX34777.1 helix-turn-helix transcriptional regulator [Fundicoccus culcitae]
MSNIVLTEAHYYILLSLYQPLHGYGIMQNVEAMSKGRVTLAAGTLYGALNALQDKGWIVALDVEKNSRKKEYKITSEGQEVVEHEIERLSELYTNGKKILGGLENGKDSL